jgi:acyl-CoA dehydrogenase
MNEAEYLQRWQGAVESRASPYAMAVAGGAIADALAWVFVAGYQAALRMVFPEICTHNWAAFVVSEDRSATQPLPGVEWVAHNGGYKLTGHKTWIAAVDHVQQLVVRAKGAPSGYFLVATDSAGLSLQANPKPGLLPQLSQGRAHFAGVELDAAAKMDASRVPGFGASEALYIYTAFLAMTAQQLEQTPVSSGAEPTKHLLLACRAALDTAALADAAITDVQLLAQLDDEVQQIRQHLSSTIFADDEAWQRDQQLIAMYSKGIQARRGEC